MTPPLAALPAVYLAATRLVDSLLHDARNPLNALAINVEVLAEKLKGDDGKVPDSQEKNLKAIRDQVYRVDAIMRAFADFIAPRCGGEAQPNAVEWLQHALDVVGHEARRRRVRLKPMLDAGGTLMVTDSAALNLLVVQALLRAIQRAEPGAEVTVQLGRTGERSSVRITEPGSAPVDPAEPIAAMAALATEAGVALDVRDGECVLVFGA